MTISIPDTFTPESSGKYIMSIRLSSGGLSFSAYNPEVVESFFYRRVDFDRTEPFLSSLKEVFFDNEFLVRIYKRIDVLTVSSQYTLVPDELSSDKNKKELFSLNFTKPEKRILTNRIKDEQVKLLFGIDEEVYEFCSRSLTNPNFIHHITPLLVMLRNQSTTEGQKHLYTILHRKRIDLICYNQGKLLFVNSFTYEQLEDILYYILYVWRQLEMDQLNDRLSLAGDVAFCNKISQSLHTYIQYIARMEIPSEAYLLGGEILQAPMDLILHTVCEL